MGDGSDPYWSSDAFYRVLAEGAREGIWVIDAEARTVFANARMARLLGCDIETLLDRPLFDFLFPEDHADARERLSRRREGIAEQFELTLRRCDGRPLHALVGTAPLLADDGSYIGAMAMVADIGDRVALERRLRARELQLAGAEHLAGLGSWSWDPHGDEMAWSDELYRLYGLAPRSERISFEGYLAKVHPDDRERIRELVADALERREGFAFEERILLPDGRERRLVSRGELLLDRYGDVERVIGICLDVTERRAGEARLDYLVRHDPVTGLVNRYVLAEHIDAAVHRAHRVDSQVGLLLLDLDRFKHINDSLGHGTGDRVLEVVAQRLEQRARSTDTVSRTGGDEFAVVMDGIEDSHEAAQLAGLLLDALREPVRVDDYGFELSAAIGIACFPGDGADAPTLLKHADAALYRAKSQGGGRFAFFSEQIGAQAAEYLQISARLQHALRQRELFLVYQPRIALDSGRVACVEALVRWRHPELGVIGPLRFIPTAEETGQIVALGDFVLGEACAELMRWREAGLPRLQLAVNLSNRQLVDPGFVTLVDAVLRETGFPPQDLEFEITESTTAHDHPEVGGMLAALGRRGIALAIDDFGTGYSSLAQLRQLPVDRVKIDRGFVEGLPGRGDARAIVGAIVAMARELGLATTAEGIEDEGQLDYVRSIGCDEAQGFFLARPLEAAELLARLQRDGDGLRLLPPP